MMGLKDGVLIEPLVEALLTDEDEDVREEAADSLAFYLNDPRAMMALENAAANDVSMKVQRHARVAIGRR